MVSIVSAVRDLARLREIYVVLARHGFGEVVSRLSRRQRAGGSIAPPPGPESVGQVPVDAAAQGEDEQRRISLAERIRLVLTDLGPSFVKLGQIASTRPDLLPADLIAELKKLQDDVPQVPFEEIRAAVESALGAPIGEVYESFDARPLAAGSIAQAHRAVLRTADGPREVVVKVQRPGIAATIARDLELLHILAATIERAIPESRIYTPTRLVAQFDRAMTSELDFNVEAENARKFARNFEGNGAVRFPEVFREASTKTVLSLEFLPGKKLADALAAGFDGARLARGAIAPILQMVFEDGFFHADPHPGNLLILGTPEAPVIGIIDLGMVGRLSPEMRDKTMDLMIAAVRQDSDGVADALYALGTPTRKVDMRAYRARVGELAEKYLGRSLKDIEVSGLIRDIMRGAMEFGIEVNPDFVLVGKALMTIEGIGKQLDPDLDIFVETRPYFLDLLRKRYSPQKLGNELWRGFEKLSGAAYDLPVQMREVLEDLRLGRFTMKTQDPAMPKALDRLGRRVFSALVVAALIGAGAWLLGSERTSAVGVVLLVLAVVQLVGHIVLDWRRG